MNRTIVAAVGLAGLLCVPTHAKLAAPVAAESDLQALRYWEDMCPWRSAAVLPLEQDKLACEIRDAITEFISLRGWCYGPPDVSGDSEYWYPCGQPTISTPVQPTTPQPPASIRPDQMVPDIELGEDAL